METAYEDRDTSRDDPKKYALRIQWRLYKIAHLGRAESNLIARNFFHRDHM
jgi:hypothetical protein